eukprot:2651338-Prymnesium_polylepis.2
MRVDGKVGLLGGARAGSRQVVSVETHWAVISRVYLANVALGARCDVGVRSAHRALGVSSTVLRHPLKPSVAKFTIQTPNSLFRTTASAVGPEGVGRSTMTN